MGDVFSQAALEEAMELPSKLRWSEGTGSLTMGPALFHWAQNVAATAIKTSVLTNKRSLGVNIARFGIVAQPCQMLRKHFQFCYSWLQKGC